MNPLQVLAWQAGQPWGLTLPGGSPKHDCCTEDVGGKRRGCLTANLSILWFGSFPGSPGAFWGKARKREQGEGEREGRRGTCFYRQGGAACACQGQNCWLFPGLTFYRGEESHPTCTIAFQPHNNQPHAVGFHTISPMGKLRAGGMDSCPANIKC